MSVEFNGKNASDITLMDSLLSWDLSERNNLTEDNANLLFVELANEGRMLPCISDLEDKESIKERQEFEEQVVITTQGQTVLVDQLAKQFERFSPQAGEPGSTIYNAQFRKFLEERGIVSNGENLEEIRKSTRESLDHLGSAVYLPRGITKQGKVVADKVYYLPKQVEDEFSKSSAWELIPEELQKVLDNSYLVHVGLSVGSKLAEVGAAMGVRAGFTLADFGTLHLDAEGRLSGGFDRKHLGMNKAVHMLFYLMEKLPYANFKIFTEGLTENNRDQIINPQLLSREQLTSGGKLIVGEEADGWKGKLNTRRAVHSLPENFPWILNMFGDVGRRVVISTEIPGSVPFNGYIAKVDPEGDPYGVNIPEKDLIKALVGSVGGFSGIPRELLLLFAFAKIGRKISRVPQSREATELAGALFAESLRIIAEGGELTPYAVADVGKWMDNNWTKKSRQRSAETRMQHKLNLRTFGLPSLVK